MPIRTKTRGGKNPNRPSSTPTLAEQNELGQTSVKCWN